MATTSPTAGTLPSPRASPSSPTTTTTTTTAAAAAAAPSSPPRPAKPRPTLRILCLGDSLTSGYSPSSSSSGGRPHPYAPRLAAVLSPAFPSLSVVADVDGVPGDSAARIARRAERRFLARGGGNPYDWTVVLGGTNDLLLPRGSGAGAGAREVFEALRGVWGLPLSKGGRVLVCTVPEAGAGARARAREELNGLLREHRQEGFHVFDLEAAIPYRTMSAPERARYWDDDRVHLTPEGYDLMGEKIAAALVELIMPPGRLQPAAGGRPPKKRRMIFRDDNKKFEEEDGDEKSLDQGWIVVRRKDLE